MHRQSLQQNETEKVEKFGRIEHNKVLVITSIIILLPVALLLLGLFFWLTDLISTRYSIFDLHPIWMLGFLSIPILPMAILHELSHGKAAEYLLPDTDVKYGFKVMYKIIPVAYTNFEGFVYKNQFVYILLAPLVMLTPILLIPYLVFAFIGAKWSLVLAGLFYFTFFNNVLGAFADSLSVLMLRPYPDSILLENKIDDFYGANLWTSINTTEDIEVLKQIDVSGSKFEKPLIFICSYLVAAAVLFFIVPLVLILSYTGLEGEITILAWTVFDYGFTSVVNSDGNEVFVYESGVFVSNWLLFHLMNVVLVIPIYLLGLKLLARSNAIPSSDDIEDVLSTQEIVT